MEDMYNMHCTVKVRNFKKIVLKNVKEVEATFCMNFYMDLNGIALF